MTRAWVKLSGLAGTKWKATATCSASSRYRIYSPICTPSDFSAWPVMKEQLSTSAEHCACRVQHLTSVSLSSLLPRLPMAEAVTSAIPVNGTHSASASSAEVYAVFGAEPEVLAYAMAKYSRSALSMKESLKEISAQKAEKFLNTFYFQYGHRSIADLAHIALAVERLSILAAIVV